MNPSFRSLAAFAAAGSLALGVAACGGDDNEQTTGGSASSEQQSQSKSEAQPKPVAQIDELNGRTTKVTLDAGFVQALTDLKLAPAPVGDAKISKQGVATFPITGGNVTYFEPGSVSPYVRGELQHSGAGLSLTGGGKTVELTDFVIDPGASVLTGTVSVDGEVAAENAPLFFLDGRTLKPLRTNDAGTLAILEGTTVKLKEEAAQLLNDTFGVDALQGGFVIGVAKLTVNTQ